MDSRQLAENYVAIWNADARRELVDQIFLTDFVDHNPQPGQERMGSRASTKSSTRTTAAFRDFESRLMRSSSPVTGLWCAGLPWELTTATFSASQHRIAKCE